MPGGELQDRAGDNRTQDGRRQDRHCGKAEDADHTPSCSASHHHLRHRCQQATAHALQGAKSNQGVRRPRKSTQRRGECERRKAP
jgi:hypothetical protein